MNENINSTTSTTSEYSEKSTSNGNILKIMSDENNSSINRNKPWRRVIRRIVSDGRSDYENISGKFEDSQSM